MGLAGRKQKQRIPNDPRNLSWADDANKFGAAYLQKLGWSAGSGLGASGDGRTTHIKVNQKLDMLGIGAAHQKDPNGIAWKQNKDFENLLKRLNGANGEDREEVEVSKIDGFAKAREVVDEEDVEVTDVVDFEEGSSTKKRKRKDGEDGKDGRKKSKKGEDLEEKKEKKKEKKSKDKKAKAKAEVEVTVAAESPAPENLPKPPTVARPIRAHRARFLASKRIASKSSTAIDEILGISRSATATPYPEPSIPSTPLDTPSEGANSSEQDELKLQTLTTSAKSVMDYFKDKLLAKLNGASSSSTPISATTPSTPREDDDDDYDDRPRGLGIGFGRSGIGAGVGSSKLRSDVTFAEVIESDRIGIGMFSRLSTNFTSSKDRTTNEEAVEVETETVTQVVEVVDDVGRERKKKKKDKERGKRAETKSDEETKDDSVKEVADDSENSLKKSRKGKGKSTNDEAEEETRTEEHIVSEVPTKARKEKKSKRKAHRAGVEREVVEEEPKTKKKKSSNRDGAEAS